MRRILVITGLGVLLAFATPALTAQGQITEVNPSGVHGTVVILQADEGEEVVRGDTATPTRYSESRQQQLREAELVLVRVADVKEALAPGSIHQFVGMQPGRSERLVVCIDLGNTEDYPPPPLSLVGGDGRQIHEGFAESKAAERSVLAAAQHREPQLPVESNRASHVPNRERYSADVLDFRHRIRIVIATRASQSSSAYRKSERQ